MEMVKQDSRVYMLCKVAQVFDGGGYRSIVLFPDRFGEESWKNNSETI